jgi:PhoPQ-activated pathogenicity-related protein
MKGRRVLVGAAALVGLIAATFAAVLLMGMPNRMVVSGNEVVDGKVILDGLRQVVRKEGYDILVSGATRLDGKDYRSGQYLTWNEDGMVVPQAWYQRVKNSIAQAAWRAHLALKPVLVSGVTMNNDGLFEVIVSPGKPMRFQ